MTDYN